MQVLFACLSFRVHGGILRDGSCASYGHQQRFDGQEFGSVMDNLSLDLETLVHRLQTDEIKVILKGKPKYITFVPPHPSSEPFSQFSDDRTPCGLYGDEGRGVCHSQLTEGAPLDVISFS